MVNKVTTVNLFVLHILRHSITRLAILTLKKTATKMENLKVVCVCVGGGGGGGGGKSYKLLSRVVVQDVI